MTVATGGVGTTGGLNGGRGFTAGGGTDPAEAGGGGYNGGTGGNGGGGPGGGSSYFNQAAFPGVTPTITAGPNNANTGDGENSLIYEFEPPSLDIVKSTPANADEDGSGSVSIGDTLTYTITATNDGGVAQTDVVVSDPMLTGDNTTTCATLAVGASCVLTGDYVVLASDADGDIVNTASVESDEVTTPVEATQTTPVAAAAPGLSMTKTADNPGPHKAGDVITYTYTVTNEGNTAISDVVVNDTHNGSNSAPTPLGETLLTDTAPANDSVDATSNDGTWDILAPGDVVTFTGTYTVTQTDVDNL